MKITEKTSKLLEARRFTWVSLVIGAVLVVAGVILTFGGFKGNGGQPLWVWGLGLLLAGGIALACTHWVTIHLDKPSQTASIYKRYLLWRASEIEFPFDQVREVIVQQKIQRSHRTSSGGDSQSTEQLKYFLIFQMKDGQQHGIDVSPSSQSNFMGVWGARFTKNNELMRLGNAIAQFLNVPFRDQMAPTVGEAFELVRELGKQANKMQRGE